MAVIAELIVVAFCAFVAVSQQANTELDNGHSNRSRTSRQLPVLPNGAQCFKNLDCASGCCLLESCFIGICIAEAQKGQVCGLLSTNPWGPPGFLSHIPDIIGGPGI